MVNFLLPQLNAQGPDIAGSFMRGFQVPYAIQTMQARNELLNAELGKRKALKEYAETGDINVLKRTPETYIRMRKLEKEEKTQDLGLQKLGLEIAKQSVPYLMANPTVENYRDFANTITTKYKIPASYFPPMDTPEKITAHITKLQEMAMSPKDRAALTTPTIKDIQVGPTTQPTAIYPGGAMKPLGPGGPKWKPERYLPEKGEGTGVWISPGDNVPEGYIPEKQKIMAASELDLTPQSIDQMARRYILDGTMPGLGLGKAATKARSMVMNRVPEIMGEEGLTPQGAVANKMVYAGLRTEVSRLLGQRGPMLAFAKTAEENLNLALQLSGKVGRLGSPAIDRWILGGRKSLAGDPDVASFDAAVRVAINEFAKVTSSATGGGITSDTARKEIQDVLYSAQTPEQFKAVVQTLRIDMDNRIKGYDYQLNNIQESLRNVGEAGTGGGIARKSTQAAPISPEEAMQELRRRGRVK